MDLFGEEIVLVKGIDKKGNVRGGFAAKPGTGPKGETCGSCVHIVRRFAPYLKCALMQSHWTNGPGTDIKARSPACAKWGK